ncbi:MAG TPA: hypothetical protein PL078_03910 [Bacillota bacterium]|jgi:hypothetical protein|nr:hypothetical protein [Peptococcaceae bacterium MAG4]NLW39100.1 hypothetical protein [Peptococcaceae bacterium]HPU35553.1 hypothetical protein [Bacillota bacterium]HPZ43131.1 hypothetical protein [Bacillota bacterium]HQD75869.1 hypothetical protein [Bacillota bacterium]
MKWFLLIVPLVVCYYTITYGHWALKKGYRRGAVGVFMLAAFTMALAVYALFFRESF